MFLLTSLTVFAQPSETKLVVDRADYTSLLITANLVADKLNLKIDELELVNKQLEASKKISEKFEEGYNLLIAKNQAVMEGVDYQLEKMEAYIKYLKKRVRKAWFNGLWQGNVMMAIIVYVLILL